MKTMKNPKSLAQAALIAALYVALTLLFAPISYGEVQVRIAEALTILPVFTPVAVPALFVGCLLANLLGGALPFDILFGSLATLIGALITRALKDKPLISPIGPIAANALIVPLVLRYAYGVPLALWILALSIAAGELLSAGVLGLLLYKALNTRPIKRLLEDKR